MTTTVTTFGDDDDEDDRSSLACRGDGKINYGSELVSVGASVSNEEILVITNIRTSASYIFRKIRYSMIKNAMVIMIFVLLSHRLRGRSTIKYLVTILYR